MLVDANLTKTEKADSAVEINEMNEIRALQISNHPSATLLKIRYFPLSFAKFLRTPFLQTLSDDCF